MSKRQESNHPQSRLNIYRIISRECILKTLIRLLYNQPHLIRYTSTQVMTTKLTIVSISIFRDRYRIWKDGRKSLIK